MAQGEGTGSSSRSSPIGHRQQSPQAGPNASKDRQCSSLRREILPCVLLKGSIKTIVLHAAFPPVCIVQEQRSSRAPAVTAVPSTAHSSSPTAPLHPFTSRAKPLQPVTPVDVLRWVLCNHELLLSTVKSPALHKASLAKHNLYFRH